MKTQTYRTIIEKDGNGFHGYVPALPGCHTQGDTIEETKKNLEEAMQGWLESRIAHGWSVPDSDVIESFQTVTIPTTHTNQPVYA